VLLPLPWREPAVVALPCSSRSGGNHQRSIGHSAQQ
jgi:hypothetical protein